MLYLVVTMRPRAPIYAIRQSVLTASSVVRLRKSRKLGNVKMQYWI